MCKQVLHYMMPIVKLVVFILCLIACALPVGLFKFVPVINNLDNKYATVVVESLLMISIFGALFLMAKMYSPLTLNSFFLLRNDALKGFLKGTALGVVILAICAGILALIGSVAFSPGKISLGLFFYYMLYFLVIAIFEELFFRTYPLFVFAESYPIVIAVLINGVLFGFLHALNPGFTWLAMINITLAGVLFSLFTLYHRSINWAIGIHMGWNFTQGILFGYKVSGTDTPSVLIAKPLGVAYLSGGGFGIEGSIVCTIVLAILIAYLAIKYRIKPILIINKHEFTGTR